MDNFYSPDHHQRQRQAQAQAQAQANAMSMPPPGHNPAVAPMAASQSMLPTDTSLDSMTSVSPGDLYRRRSMPHAFGNTMTPVHDNRRMSIGIGDMANFGGDSGDLSGYQFGQTMPPTYPTDLAMPDQMSGYMPGAADFSPLSPDLMGSMMASNFANMNMDAMAADSSSMDLYGSAPASAVSTTMPGHFDPSQLGSMGNDFPMDLSPDGGSLGVNAGTGSPTTTSPTNVATSGLTPGIAAPTIVAPTMPGTVTSAVDPQNDMMDAGARFASMDATMNQKQDAGTGLDANVAKYGSNLMPPLSRNVSSSDSVSPQRGNSATSTDVTTPATPREHKEPAIYSKSGFDMLKALWLVATRKDPKIHLGAVDMSCAFVVCDVSMNDCPIIYVSDNFQNLTGYSRHEIVGQNCRFLQAPDGKVEAGSKREFVDDGAVYNLKQMIEEGKEVQQSLINYRKGGKPFLNLLTMIPIPWDTDEIRYIIGFQIDLVECPDAIASGQDTGGVKVNYKHSDIGQYIWTPPTSSQWEPENGQTLGVDDVSTLLQQFNPKGLVSDWHKQSWDKMLLENTDDVVHVLSLKGLFLYLSPSCKKILEYDAADLAGNSLSSVCHPSDIVPVTRELKEATAGNQVNIVFRIRRRDSGYTWFESHGSLFVEQGKGRKCIILVGRKRPVFALSRCNLESNGGIGDSELWTKLSTSGMFLFVSSSIRSLLDLQPEALVGTSIQELMRKESRLDFGRAIEKARRGKTVTCKHEVQNRRGQVLQAQTVLYPGDASEGQKPSFLLAQTKLMKASSRSISSATPTENARSGDTTPRADVQGQHGAGELSQAAGTGLAPGSQDAALASDDNIFDELRTTKCSSWQFELRQMEKVNRILAEELGGLLSNKKKRKRRKGVGNMVRDCANCHTRNTPEWRRGPSGQRDLCNSCGLRWAKQTGRVSPRNSSRGGNSNGNGARDSMSGKSASPQHSSPLHSGASPDPHAAGGQGVINPAQLTNQQPAYAGSAASGGTSATGLATTMPPPSQSTMTSGAQSVGMTSIREERETSQP